MFELILESWPWPGFLNTNELSLIFRDPWYVVVNKILKMPAIQNLTSSSLLWFSFFFWHSWPSSTKRCAPVSKQIHISLLAFSGLRNQAFVSFCRVRLLVCTATLQQDLESLGFLHCSNTPYQIHLSLYTGEKPNKYVAGFSWIKCVCIWIFLLWDMFYQAILFVAFGICIWKRTILFSWFLRKQLESVGVKLRFLQFVGRPQGLGFHCVVEAYG